MNQQVMSSVRDIQNQRLRGAKQLRLEKARLTAEVDKLTADLDSIGEPLRAAASWYKENYGNVATAIQVKSDLPKILQSMQRTPGCMCPRCSTASALDAEIRAAERLVSQATKIFCQPFSLIKNHVANAEKLHCLPDPVNNLLNELGVQIRDQHNQDLDSLAKVENAFEFTKEFLVRYKALYSDKARLLERALSTLKVEHTQDAIGRVNRLADTLDQVRSKEQRIGTVASVILAYQFHMLETKDADQAQAFEGRIRTLRLN